MNTEIKLKLKNKKEVFIMEKYYNINEVAMMTGLTTRTVRNYLKQGLVSAEKIDGVWKFSPENFGEMLSVPAVKQSVKARNNSVIFDFIANDRKRENKICLCFDLYVDESEAEEISGFFCDKINSCGADDICFNFEKNGRNARIILSGPEDTVSAILTEYYSE